MTRYAAAVLFILFFGCVTDTLAPNDADGGSGGSQAGGGADGGDGGDGSGGDGGERVTTCDDSYPEGTVFASTVGPGYDPANASATFINALTSAEPGSTVVIDYVAGSDGVWNIEEMYPSWFDGNSGDHQVADDVTLIFEEGVTLRALSETYDDPSGLGMLLRLEDVSGWSIYGYGATLEFAQAGLTDGEFRNNIGLYDCTNIHIEGLIVDGSGGDGLLVGTRTQTGYSENISVKNVRFVNHRRQGTTLVSVSGFLSENVKLNRTSYRPPNSGIDFEPNYDTQRLDDITFTNSELAYNDYTGILFAFAHQSGPSVDFDITFNDTYIHDNWQADGDEVNGYSRAAIVMGNAGGASEASANQGHITFNRLLIRDEEYSGLFTVKHGLSYQLNFNDWVIDNIGNRNVENDRFPIFTNRYDYGSTLPPQGRLAITGLLVVEDRDEPFFRLAGSSADNWSIDNMTISDARIVTPYTGEGIDNVQNKTLGPGTSLDFTQDTTAPPTSLSVSVGAETVARGSATSVTVTRSSRDVTYPLAVDYTIAGTADNFDDFDGLHGFVIIPANSTSTTIPIVARDKCGMRETVTITLSESNRYDVDAADSVSVTLLEAASL